ncbi:hypothetical protein [Egicoccus sp. AB-alg6-2]
MTMRRAVLGVVVVLVVFAAVFVVTRWSAEVANDAGPQTDVGAGG